MNKKAVGGIMLAAILIGAVALILNASADLRNLDKFETLINIILNIQNTVNNILTEITV
ncbi:MAG: hypothetical protein QXU32_04860 [Nitrososphaerales archaeon]